MRRHFEVLKKNNANMRKCVSDYSVVLLQITRALRRRAVLLHRDKAQMAREEAKAKTVAVAHEIAEKKEIHPLRRGSPDSFMTQGFPRSKPQRMG